MKERLWIRRHGGHCDLTTAAGGGEVGEPVGRRGNGAPGADRPLRRLALKIGKGLEGCLERKTEEAVRGHRCNMRGIFFSQIEESRVFKYLWKDPAERAH